MKQTKIEEPAQATLPKAPVMRAFAVVTHYASEVVDTIEAPTLTDLKKMLIDPKMTIHAVFRGKQIKVEAQRRVSFS